MKTLSRKSSITFQINETESFAATGGIHGRNSGARRPENREPQAAAASAPEPQGPQGSGRSDTAGPGSHAAKIGRRKSLQRRSTTKIRRRNHRKTVDNRKPGGGNRRKGDRQPKSGAEPTAKRLTTKNRTNKSRCKGNRQPKSNAEPTARQLTTGNRAGKVAARRLTAGNRSAETIDNRESGRRELPETAAARPLRRISRDGPRRRIPLPT